MSSLKKLVNAGIREYLDTGSCLLLITAIPKMERAWAVMSKDSGDYRTGYESYGYETPSDTMGYISDRWNCAFRLKWIIDGLLDDKFTPEQDNE